MANWYTSDPHFGHDKMISSARRPFRDTGHMDAVLIERLWERVKPDDDLWILGDFAFGPKAKDEDWLLSIFHQLPGKSKHLVIGNHDNDLTLALPWASTSLMTEMSDNAQQLTLCHYPMITWNNARKGALHLFGHVHGNWRGTSNSVNVGVDVWDFYPTSVREIVTRAKGLPPNKHWKDVEARNSA